MLKLAGAVLLFFSCSGMGFLKSRQYQGRILQLGELVRIMGFLKGEISFAVSTLPEAMERISKKSGKPFSDFLFALADRMRRYSGENFSQILEELMKDILKDTYLEKEDLEEFYQAACNLGYLDKEMQIHILEQYLKEQEEKIRALRIQLPEKTKFFRSIGILAGVFLIILLI